ncbi:MAG: bifunctional 3-deoxy-7-phosphoheptulonate synthase/chorismate mutase type II [Muribaculaceae bacterium]|nr:bifunctional 3-deoxy-7-phosphoheptulonate synthase/chorismate mutase type II [Muribaculaceae bacterium]
MTDLQPIFNQAPMPRPLVIAGPCSAESRSQTVDTALALAAQGIKVFRAGVWKPRTKPGGFEGIGSPALSWLAEVQDRTGMEVITEVACERHMQEVIRAGIKAVWIGARTAANPFAVQEIADCIAALPEHTRSEMTVLVKNPVNPDLELWIGALERIYGAGIRRLGAIHRGFSAYGPHLYRNPPQWRIPIELHRRNPALPIISDPSHIGGRRDLIAPLAQQALDINFDGIIVECHPDPDSALSDAAQQITPQALKEITAGLTPRPHDDAPAGLDELRRQIDSIDTELLDLLARRMRVAREIGSYKRRERIPVVQPVRYNDLMQRRTEAARQLGLSPDFIRTVLAAIHEESVRQQIEEEL